VGSKIRWTGKSIEAKGSFRGASPLLYEIFPFPLIRGKGISPSQVKDKGDRVTYN